MPTKFIRSLLGRLFTTKTLHLSSKLFVRKRVTEAKLGGKFVYKLHKFWQIYIDDSDPLMYEIISSNFADDKKLSNIINCMPSYKKESIGAKKISCKLTKKNVK